LIDVFRTVGFTFKYAYRVDFGVFGLCCFAAYLFFLWQSRHNEQSATRTIGWYLANTIAP
jgi:hypothetical protein